VSNENPGLRQETDRLMKELRLCYGWFCISLVVSQKKAQTKKNTSFGELFGTVR
jgi:hypothetical protein